MRLKIDFVVYLVYYNDMKYLVGDIEMGGFGAMYARRKLIMQIAEAFNREPVFRFTNYVYEDPFLPLPSTLKTLKEQGINEIKRFTFTDTEDTAVYFDFNSYWGSKYCDTYQCWHPKSESYLLYSGKIYNKLKLNEQFANEIENKIQQIKDDWKINSFENVIGLHFRKGDKINESLYMSEDYVVNFIKENFDVKKQKVFITSDDEECILSIVQKYSDIDFIYDKNENRYGKQNLSNMQLVIDNPILKHDETLTFMKNIEILKQCSNVIGCYNVQLTKISGCINSFIKKRDTLSLINPYTNSLDTMGSSIITS